MEKYKILVLSLCLFIVIPLLAQTSDSTYQQYLQNNSKVPKRYYYASDSKNILKTDIVAMLDGNIPLIWEHRFSEHWGLDGGVGVLLKYSMNDYVSKKDFDDEAPFGLNTNFKNNKLGFSCQLEPKIFLSDNSVLIDKGYTFLSLYYKNLFYSRLSIREIGVGYGFTADFDHTTLQMILSILYVRQSIPTQEDEFKYLGPFSSANGTEAKGAMISLRIQLGYIFNSRKQPIIQK